MNSPLKWHGGKHYLAKRLVAMMPSHLHYVEPYAGGLSVLLAKNPEGVSEVVNDIDGDLANFWACLRDDIAFRLMSRHLQAMPFSERDWREAGCPDESDGYWARSPKAPVDSAIAFFVRVRQSMAGRRESFSPLTRRRVRRGMNEQASQWLSAIDGLPDVHARLRRVVILNRPALEVIRTQDGPGTLFYLDPPYLPSTRTAPAVYAHEMSDRDHVELLGAIAGVEGKVMLSGYPSALYDSALAGWRRVEFDLPNHAGGAGAANKIKRRMTEVVWCNF